MEFGSLGLDPLRVREVEEAGAPGIVSTAPAGAAAPDQFWLYELPGGEEGLVDPHRTEPMLAGSDDKPDALLSIELEAFNFGKNHRPADPKSRAALRLDVGKDRGSSSNLDLLMWSASSAIDLAKQIKSGRKPRDLTFRGNEIFRRRPIEIPGGLGQINIEVVRHEDPAWWQKIISTVTGSTGQDLLRTLGFPGITTEVLGFINQSFSQFQQNNAKIIFQSRPLTFAVTKRAKSDFTDDNRNHLVASLKRGRYLVARQSDAEIIHEAKAVYAGGYGQLAPKQDFDQNGDQFDYSSNTLSDLTYGILRVKTRETVLPQSVDGP